MIQDSTLHWTGSDFNTAFLNACRVKGSLSTAVCGTKDITRIHKCSTELAVLMHYFNSTFCQYTLSLQVLGVVTVVVNSTFGIVFLSSRGLIMAAALCVITLCSYKGFGELYEESNNIVLKWQGYNAEPESSDGLEDLQGHTDL